MEKFKFSGHASSWPCWFNTLAEKGKVRINIDVKQVCDNDDDWREYRTYIAFLWTPGNIIVAYEGNTIVNCGAYCELEQRQMAAKRLAKASDGGGCEMENKDKPLGLLHYIKPTFEDSLVSKLLDKAEESNGGSIDKSPTSGD